MSDDTRNSTTSTIKYVVYWVLFVLAIYIAFRFVFGQPNALRFSERAFFNIGVVLAPLIVIALFVERAVEVIVTPMHGKKSEDLEMQMRSAQDKVSGERGSTGGTDVLYSQFTEERNRKRNHAFGIAVTLGMLAALSGIRSLEGLLQAEQVIPLAFKVFDVLLTGLVIGGGAEGIHKIVTMFTDYAEKVSRDAKRG